MNNPFFFFFFFFFQNRRRAILYILCARHRGLFYVKVCSHLISYNRDLESNCKLGG
jgi:hypothetical protein